MPKASSRYAFPPSLRLKKSKQFRKVQNEGQKHFSKYLLLIVHKGLYPHARIGITITTKIDKRAVVRNKLKRRIREAFRKFQDDILGSFDLVVIARQNATERSYQEIEDELLYLFRRAKCLKIRK